MKNVKNELLKRIGLGPKQKQTKAPAANNAAAPPDDRVNRKSSLLNAAEPSAFRLQPSAFLRNPSTNRTPRGKVAHLPPEVRARVCEWISEGVTLEQITKNLADLGHPGFNHKNISNWKENGYRTWCQHQERHERARLRAEDSMSFAAEEAYSDALVAAAEIDAANALEDAMLAYNPNADPETQLEQTKIILNKTRSLALLNLQRQRYRKLTFQEQCHRDKLNGLLKKQRHETETGPASATASAPAAPAPATEEDQRAAFLKLVDKWLGIKPRGVRPSPGAAARENTRPVEVPEPTAPTCPPPSPANFAAAEVSAESENPRKEPEASGTLRKAPTANESTLTPTTETSAALPSPMIGRGQGEGDSDPVPQPVTETNQPSSFAALPSTADDDQDWEKLLESPSAAPSFLPEPEPLPQPYSADAKPLNHLPIPSLNSAYPPAPLLQPEGTLAICNYNGVITAWVPESEDPSKAKHWIQKIKDHKTGKTICWFDNHSRPPGMTDDDAVRGRPHFIPVFDGNGRIINWAPEPDGKHKRPPTLAATALESQDHPRMHFAWLQPSTVPINPAVHGGD